MNITVVGTGRAGSFALGPANATGPGIIDNAPLTLPGEPR